MAEEARNIEERMKGAAWAERKSPTLLILLFILRTCDFSLSKAKPAMGGPKRAAPPLTKVRAPKDELRWERPRRSTRRRVVTVGRAEIRRPKIPLSKKLSRKGEAG